MDWAGGVVPSVAGDISVELKKLKKGETDAGLQIRAVVPELTSSLIYVPIKPSQDNIISVNDKEIWKDGAPLNSDDMISYISKSEDFIVFEFHPGSYVIRAVNKTL